MISFIIIGRNESKILPKCLDSVRSCIDENKLDAEVIYLDSDSTDNSIEIAKATRGVRTIRITGKYNAAIARNVGANLAKSHSLFFVDADMELLHEFIPNVLSDNQELKYEFVSGNFINHYYSKEGKLERKAFYRKTYCQQDTYQSTTGGLFAIRKELWDKFGGMRPMFKKGQDLDFGYRLAKAGHLLLRKSRTMALHHTVDYKDSHRIWLSLINGANVYPRALLYRKHLNNAYVMKRLLSSDPTLLILLLVLLVFIFTGKLWVIAIYGLLSLVALLYSIKFKIKIDFISRYLNHICRDVLNLLAFFFYYPSNELKYEFEEL
ncbi:glycosyltransferase family 2 protein [Carboxylicivirga sp. N1Y90]|uniref:glycosyltransferase family 2 protein n=1 Tax=Carboxylicivirga fragile TaxID=3417571 RepID=UPI003D33D3C9|nr:glycosyltransferase family 2 protein [Marinilabiliaceae bacterium N1Y90]